MNKRILIVAALTSTLCFTPSQAQAAPAKAKTIVVKDKRGDGSPDISSFRARASRDGITLTVKVRGVIRSSPSGVDDSLLLHVDPTGKRKTPLYAFAVGLSSSSEYMGWRTTGWKLKVGNPEKNGVYCGERVRLRKWGKSGRALTVKMPLACFGDDKVRFAVKVERTNGNGTALSSDWAPRNRTLSSPVYF